MTDSSGVSEDTIFRRSEDIRYRVVDSEAVVIRQSAAEVLGLNEVGARVLDLIDARTPVRKLVDILAQEFEVGRETLQRDICGFLGELAAAGVILKVETPESGAECGRPGGRGDVVLGS